MAREEGGKLRMWSHASQRVVWIFIQSDVPPLLFQGMELIFCPGFWMLYTQLWGARRRKKRVSRAILWRRALFCLLPFGNTLQLFILSSYLCIFCVRVESLYTWAKSCFWVVSFPFFFIRACFYIMVFLKSRNGYDCTLESWPSFKLRGWAMCCRHAGGLVGPEWRLSGLSSGLAASSE